MQLMTRRTVLQLLPAVALARPSGEQYQATWESLKQYRVPQWFRDAKFGIWAHWGPQCVPMTGDWYARNMYIEDSDQYKYHIAHYGHPSKFGYKDIVPLWKAENFDPDRLVQRYRKAGAKYFISMGVHHDNFDIWNSKHHRWNAAAMGPKKDIVGLWRQAARKHGLRFGVTEHLERSWSWFNVNKGADKKGPLAGVPYDGNDPKYQDFYFPPHEDNNSRYPKDPPDSWKQQWFNRIKDLVDSYQPDLLYTDGGIPFGEVGRNLVAHYYNQSLQWHGGKMDVCYTIKNVKDKTHGDYEEGCCLLDLERGVVADTRSDPWQTDTCVGNWFYKRDIKYKTAETVVQLLVDIVSKNGNMLLNFPLRPDGTLDSEEDRILEGITKWMAANSEAIYATRPWEVYGEGPTRVEGGQFSERKLKQYTGQDVRFTTKGKTLYATLMAWPGNRAVIKSLNKDRKLWFGEIRSVQMLGLRQALKWSRDADGLKVQLPDRAPGDYAFVLKIG